MIDYLEQLFAVATPETERLEQADEGKFLPEWAELAVPEGRKLPDEVFPMVGQENRFHSREDPNVEWTTDLRAEILRPREEARGENLERRLRRDSRRYDSGFFWY